MFTRQFEYCYIRVHGWALHQLTCKTTFPEGSFRTNRASNQLNLWDGRMGLSLCSADVVESIPFCGGGGSTKRMWLLGMASPRIHRGAKELRRIRNARCSGLWEEHGSSKTQVGLRVLLAGKSITAVSRIDHCRTASGSKRLRRLASEHSSSPVVPETPRKKSHLQNTLAYCGGLMVIVAYDATSRTFSTISGPCTCPAKTMIRNRIRKRNASL